MRNGQLLAWCVMTLGVGLAQAAPPQILSMQKSGDPSCTVNNSGGVFDLGRLSSSLIQANKSYDLTPRQQDWVVSCDAEAALTFTVVDHRINDKMNAGAEYFGLGRVNGQGKLGQYRILMSQASVDGRSTAIQDSLSMVQINAVNETYLKSDGTHYGWVSPNNGMNQLTTGQVFNARFTVSPTLASREQMNGPIVGEVQLDGLATMNFSFGI